MTYYGGGLYDAEARRQWESGPVSTRYHQHFGLRGQLNWETVEDVADWFRQDFSQLAVFWVQMTDEDSTISSDEVWKAREHAERNRSRVLHLKVSVHDRHIEGGINFNEGLTTIRVEGPDQDKVLGVASRLKTAVDRGAIRGASRKNLIEYDAFQTEGRRLIRGRNVNSWFHGRRRATIVVGASALALVWSLSTGQLGTIVWTTAATAAGTLLATYVGRWLSSD